MKKLPKLKFQPGNIGIQLNELERKYLAECVEAWWDAEIGEIGREKEAFMCERIRHRLYGFKIHKTKYDRQMNKETCHGCGRELTYPELHKCKGRLERFDDETLARV